MAKSYKLSIALALLLIFSVKEISFPAESYAQRKISAEEDKKRKRLSISPSVGKTLTQAIDLINASDYNGAASVASAALNKKKLKPYDEATILEIRGSALASKKTPDYKGALRDFTRVLAIDTFDSTRSQSIIYNVAALYFSQEDYTNAIKYMKFWINNSEIEKPDAFYILAGAYVAKEEFRSALPHAEKAVSLLPKAKQSNYDLLNYIYSQTKNTTKRKALLEKMIGFWPKEKNNWAQLSGLYAESGDEKNAYIILDMAYSVGLLTKENELKALASYMAQLDNPYRAAVMVEKELKTGKIAKNRKNVEMLSLFWAQSRENKKAIPALEEAARLSGTGKLYYRLGQTYFADEQWTKAESSLKKAVNLGGLKGKEVGDIWLLLGSAQFNQVTNSNKSKRVQAKSSFSNALKYSTASKAAARWISYIRGIEEVEINQVKLEKAQNLELKKIEEERAKLEARTARLRGDSAESTETPSSNDASSSDGN